MEFEFDVNSLFSTQITRIVGGNCEPIRCRTNSAFKRARLRFGNVVDAIGIASAKAQGLRAPITTFKKLQETDQVIYVLKDTNCNNGNGAVEGILKTGRKRLFLMDASGTQHEVVPLCVLDFYVHESRQRKGCGKRLFEAMLEQENVRPSQIAIDRPSDKFLSFLKKHYSLSSYAKQANNFVVFEKFFSTCTDFTPRRNSLQLKKRLSQGQETDPSPSSSSCLRRLSEERMNRKNNHFSPSWKLSGGVCALLQGTANREDEVNNNYTRTNEGSPLSPLSPNKALLRTLNKSSGTLDEVSPQLRGGKEADGVFNWSPVDSGKKEEQLLQQQFQSPNVRGGLGVAALLGSSMMLAPHLDMRHGGRGRFRNQVIGPARSLARSGFYSTTSTVGSQQSQAGSCLRYSRCAPIGVEQQHGGSKVYATAPGKQDTGLKTLVPSTEDIACTTASSDSRSKHESKWRS